MKARLCLQVTVKHRMMNKLVSSCRDVVGHGDQPQDPSRARLRERMESLRKRWRALLTDLTSRRDKITALEASAPPKDPLHSCLDQITRLLTTPVNPSDEINLSVRLSTVKVSF